MTGLPATEYENAFGYPPLPQIDNCMNYLGDAAVLSTLECSSSCWQIPVVERDKDKTTFTTNHGTSWYTRMLFGLKNAPAAFQCAIDIVVSAFGGKFALSISTI